MSVKNLTAETTYKLQTGYEIPAIALGVWQTPTEGDVAENIVYEALKLGYRHIDSAQVYKNEAEAGKGIQKWLAEDPSHKREDVFYTTKVFRHGYGHTLKSLQESIDKVEGLKYIDLALVHNPRSNKKLRLETYKALQEFVDKGLIRSIGVSNWGIKHLKELYAWDGLKYKPTVNQVELHPFLVRQELTDFLKKNNIIAEAYSPLTRGARLDDPTLVKIAAKYNKSTAQVLIRWSLQRGYVTLPKTVNPQRLKENFEVYDFELTDEDYETLTKLDENWIISTTFGDQLYFNDITDEEYEKLWV